MININKKEFIKNSPEQDEYIIYRIPSEYKLQEYKNPKYLLNNNLIINNICKIYNSYINKNNVVFNNYKYNIFNDNTKKKHFIKKPKLNKIINFIYYIYDIGQIEPECFIILLIYVEYLLDNNNNFQLQPNNWKNIIFCSMIIASKIIDDETYENKQFAELFPQYNIQYINKLEKTYLELVDYKVNINNNIYAKYYYYLYNIKK